MARVENKKWYHLTHSQKQIWNNEKMNPNSSLYNLGGCISYIGETDIGLLEKSIRIFIEYYEGLHFRFTELNEIPFQYVDINTPNIMPVIDFTKHPDPDDQLEIWMNQQAQIPFILNKGCLFEFIPNIGSGKSLRV
ncbi:condensation domain-containing protein [Paenibacillus sp. 2TAF8]|uniref:condensation domain-containing protein n=1 Tax=Paenibacillus sp. 2TAF8 TaxID=3233020 RepID=UPI003F99E37E